jgi:hypothetical protein
MEAFEGILPLFGIIIAIILIVVVVVVVVGDVTVMRGDLFENVFVGDQKVNGVVV